VRADWGARGAAELVADGVVAVVVVDVLSFSTAVSVAADRGIAVRPHDGPPGSAEVVAAMEGATCAGARAAAGAGGAVSLSPASIAAAAGVTRLVLPSPNGSAICARLAEAGLAESGIEVVAGCLRNATAVARWLAAVDGPVGLVAAGERWDDGTLRPAAEDLVGVGAVLDGLAGLGTGRTVSPEATAAWAAYKGARVQWPGWLHGCASALELVRGGFADDVHLAGEVDASDVVPALEGGWFVPG
jgi:2-phosphosulfolactate phosphatase